MCVLFLDLTPISGISEISTSIVKLIFTMIIMQDENTANRQLTLDFSEGFVLPKPLSAPRNVTRTIVFPKHINLPNFGQFQQQVNLLFAPLAISVEFRVTRQKRLEMKWIFPPATETSTLAKNRKTIPFENLAGELSNEEVKAFETLVFAMADSH